MVAFTEAQCLGAVALHEHLGRQRASFGSSGAAARADCQLDAGLHGSAVARSAARRRLPGLCRRQQGPPVADLRGRQRRDDPRHRRPHGRRSLGVHSVQPAAQAAHAARRPGHRRLRLLRRFVRQGRRREARRPVEDGGRVRAGRRRHVLPGVRRDARRHGRDRVAGLGQRLVAAVVLQQPGRIPFLWSFPRYSMFDVDPTAAPYGDISASATDHEKSVGQTWSDPAVGQIKTNLSKYRDRRVGLLPALARERQQPRRRIGRPVALSAERRGRHASSTARNPRRPTTAWPRPTTTARPPPMGARR